MSLAYFEGAIRPLENAKLSITTHAVNYGLGAFAGIRAYWNDAEQELFMFRPIDHFNRLREAGKILRCESLPTAEQLSAIAADLLRESALREDCYIRAILYKSNGGLGARVHDVPSDVCMYAYPLGRITEKTSVRLGTSRWQRPGDNSIPARGKINGAYVTSGLAKSDAIEAGFDEPLLLDEQGHVSETAAANIFMVKNGTLITPPVYNDILEGVTRRTLIQLVNNAVQERPVDRSELFSADEIFICGTGWEIMPVESVDNRSVNLPVPGELTLRVSNLYDQAVHGNNAAWCYPIYQKGETDT